MLAEQTLGEALPRKPQPGERNLPSPPVFEARAQPDAREAVEMQRLIKAVGFGKMAKAEWMGDRVRQALEAGTITWFAVPACLALGSIVAPEPRWWHRALCEAILPFDAARLYARSLAGETFEKRKAAACELGRYTMDALEEIFRGTAYEHKYRREK